MGEKPRAIGVEGMRLQIPAYTDQWMQGDRFGELIKISKSKFGDEIARVKLDISGKIAYFLMKDCTPC